MPQWVDMTRTLCSNCHKGTYIEKFSNDDMDGILHCSKCNHGINRWSTEGDTDMTAIKDIIDRVMTELAETGRAVFSWDGHPPAGLINGIRAAVKDEGAQCRIWINANEDWVVTLRKVGLGH